MPNQWVSEPTHRSTPVPRRKQSRFFWGLVDNVGTFTQCHLLAIRTGSIYWRHFSLPLLSCAGAGRQGRDLDERARAKSSPRFNDGTTATRCHLLESSLALRRAIRRYWSIAHSQQQTLCSASKMEKTTWWRQPALNRSKNFLTMTIWMKKQRLPRITHLSEQIQQSGGKVSTLHYMIRWSTKSLLSQMRYNILAHGGDNARYNLGPWTNSIVAPCEKRSG